MRTKPSYKQLKDFLDKGKSLTEIGKIIDFSTSYISRTCKEYGLEIPRMGRPKGMKQTKEHRGKIQSTNKKLTRRGEESPNWKGGVVFKPYCPLFNNDFKERVRDFWDRKCGISGIAESENGQRLSVHHVNYEKMVCCNQTLPIFIPLCKKYHTKTNYNRSYWEENLTNYIMIWFDGESYIPKNIDEKV